MAGRKKRKKTLAAFLVVLIVLALAMACFIGYDWWQERRSHFVRYPEFGIDIPVNYSIHGIDVSKYQNLIDWASVKEMNVNGVQVGFVFIKATEGLGNEDALFQRNWRKAKTAGLIRGAYHFFLATKSGKEQAENFINSVNIETGDLPPVIDVEQAYGVPADKLRDRVKEWLQAVQDYYGVAPIIYTNVEFYKQYLKDDFDKYPLWVAHYLQKERPRIYRDWSFWQHSESGRVNGVVTKVDFNVFNGDSSDLRKLLVN
ncbi:MAG: glycoside hydrolase family 25 protein [Bacteroidetes bacterium]|nr:glycoside hydrolase family 25 protein [Bacteroidota bacterium]MBS1974984.1 glycoside hydrolase family 25 protein [Bacteroidota bacterium]